MRLSWGVEVSGGLQGECNTSGVGGVINDEGKICKKVTLLRIDPWTLI